METNITSPIYKAAYVSKIYQKDAYTFTIEWSDGRINHYRLSELQKQCPCAACVDEVTGKRLISKQEVDAFVQASRIINVGRYALRIEFTSGCSKGIYSFDELRKPG
jgi:ATP-binding protein involved in chromosome partitioning